LAGRDDLIDGVLEAVRAGPRHPGFSQGLVGDRGIGKTVLLNEIERRTKAELGWPVVVHQVVPGEALLPVLVRRVIDAAGGTWRRAGRLVRELDAELEVSADLLVVRATARLGQTAAGRRQESRSSPAFALEQLLRKTGDFARQRDSGVLISIDEAHAMDKADLAAFAASLQLVVKRAGLPIAVVLAGLPSFRRLSQGAGTYLERMPIADVGYLSDESTRYALVKPAADRGVSFSDAALEFIAIESSGYPYLVQLLGYETWKAAGGTSRIEQSAAIAGATRALRQMDEIFQARWDALSGLEREYVHAVARLGPGPVPVSAVQAALGRTSKQLGPTRARLIDDHHLLAPVGYGQIRIALVDFDRFVARLPLPPPAHRRSPQQPPG
jgi:hypothetical protein